MLEQNIRDMINNQVNQELYSAYLYLDFVRYFTERGLTGFAKWYEIQAREELDHAKIFFDYMHSQNTPVTLMAISAPVIHTNCCTACGDPDCDLKILQEGLSHEQLVTSLINDIYFAAVDVADLRTANFLTWFIREQQEEEDNAFKLISDMKLFGGTPEGLYSLDRELGQREYKEPEL